MRLINGGASTFVEVTFNTPLEMPDCALIADDRFLLLCTFNTPLEMLHWFDWYVIPGAVDFQYSIGDACPNKLKYEQGRKGGFQYSIGDALTKTAGMCLWRKAFNTPLEMRHGLRTHPSAAGDEALSILHWRCQRQRRGQIAPHEQTSFNTPLEMRRCANF